MKSLVLPCLLLSLVTGAVAAEPAINKQFQSGTSGLGYTWSAGWEGDSLIFVVVAHGQRPRELGEENAQWVKVSAAATQHPKALLYRTAREKTDLLSAPDHIYQVDKAGHIAAFNERVTTQAYLNFIASQPQEYTAEALLAFVHEQRAKQ